MSAIWKQSLKNLIYMALVCQLQPFKPRNKLSKLLLELLKSPVSFVEVETLNDSSVDFLVRSFCNGEHYFDVLYSIPEQIKKALDENNIEIPFPHRKVIVVNETA